MNVVVGNHVLVVCHPTPRCLIKEQPAVLASLRIAAMCSRCKFRAPSEPFRGCDDACGVRFCDDGAASQKKMEAAGYFTNELSHRILSLIAAGSDVIAHIARTTTRAAVVVVELCINEIADARTPQSSVVATWPVDCASAKLAHLMIVVIEVLSLGWLAKDQERQCEKAGSDEGAHGFDLGLAG